MNAKNQAHPVALSHILARKGDENEANYPMYPGSLPCPGICCVGIDCRGFTVTDRPAPDVTHLLLPVPSFDANGRIRGSSIPEHLLGELPDSITVIGGALDHPILNGYAKLDLLQDPGYLAENAAITADCAIRIAANRLKTVFKGCPMLIIGWGRIGKCLSAQLNAMDADVTVAARKEGDRAMLRALGYRTEHPHRLTHCIRRYRVIINTVPAEMIAEGAPFRKDCIKIDLASLPGIAGTDVIQARGLPGRDAPEASGLLIAKTVIRLLTGREDPT